MQKVSTILKKVSESIDVSQDGVQIEIVSDYKSGPWLDNKQPTLKCKKSSSIIIAAPHHCNPRYDEKTMLNTRGQYRTYDVNTGYIALNVAKSLGAGFLIFTNSPEDPNKTKENPYCQLLLQNKPLLLVEIHGHGSKWVPDDTVECSGGTNNNSQSVEFAMLLRKEFAKAGLENIKVLGELNDVFYKALKTATVNGSVYNSGHRKTLHIELPKSLRQTSMITKVSNCITNALKKLS